MNHLKFKCLTFVKIHRFKVFLVTLTEYKTLMTSAPSSPLFKEKLIFLLKIKVWSLLR